MKNAPSAYKVSFNELSSLFVRQSEHTLVLEPAIGKGLVHIFDLEKGLQVRFWNCSFNEEVEIYNDGSNEDKKRYFTLAFFLNRQGLKFASNTILFQENIIWDTAFITPGCDYKIYIPSGGRAYCLNISFSERWFNNNILKSNEAFNTLKEKMDIPELFPLFECMNLEERKSILELFDSSWKKPFGSFYIKSAILRITSDFFYKLKEREISSTNKQCLTTSIAEVEKYICDHLTHSLPDLKDLAQRFSMSESTLKRHFKKIYGVNISTYFFQKKLEYARKLIHEKNINICEAAAMVGYRNVNHFITMLKKH